MLDYSSRSSCHRVKRNARTMWKQGSASLVLPVNFIIHSRPVYKCKHQRRDLDLYLHQQLYLLLQFTLRCNLLLFNHLNNMELLLATGLLQDLLCFQVHTSLVLLVLCCFLQGWFQFRVGLPIQYVMQAFFPSIASFTENVLLIIWS